MLENRWHRLLPTIVDMITRSVRDNCHFQRRLIQCIPDLVVRTVPRIHCRIGIGSSGSVGIIVVAALRAPPRPRGLREQLRDGRNAEHQTEAERRMREKRVQTRKKSTNRRVEILLTHLFFKHGEKCFDTRP